MAWPGKKSVNLGLPTANVPGTALNGQGRRRIGTAAERQVRKNSFDRIEPSLAGVQLSAPAASPSTATRPPVIGRELPLDPERTKRYSSSDLQLEAYLEALRQKTVATVTASPNEATSADFRNHQSKPAISRFVKQSKPPEISKATHVSKATTSTMQTFSKATSVLQRAQVLTDKLTVSKRPMTDKPLPPPSPSPLQQHSNTDVKQSLEADVLSRGASSRSRNSSSSSRIGSFMNIRDIEDLPLEVQPELPNKDKSLASASRHSSLKQESKDTSDEVTELIEEQSMHPSIGTSSSQVRTEQKSSPKVVVVVSRSSSIVSASSSEKQVTASLVPSYSYSEDFETEPTEPSVVTSSNQKGSVRSRSTSSKNGRRLMVSRHVQTTMPPEIASSTGMQRDPDRLAMHPSVPLSSFADPQRVSSYVVSGETLRALSSYSPSMMALDELMRHQLRTTRSFLDAQRRMYVSVVESLKPNHRYTTWTDTQRLIATIRNRRKAAVT